METIKIMPCLDMKGGRVFTKAIADAVTVPVVASGGAGKLVHFYDGVVKGGAQILLAASVFHFRTFRIREVKEYLRSQGLQVNL